MNEPLAYLADLEELAESNSLQWPEVLARSIALGKSPAGLLDAMSTDIALKYSRKEISFDHGDRVMNALWGLACSFDFLASNDRTIPDTTQRVFLAFDEGEYIHQGDGEDVDPVAKYTDPLIQQFVGSLNTSRDRDDA